MSDNKANSAPSSDNNQDGRSDSDLRMQSVPLSPAQNLPKSPFSNQSQALNGSQTNNLTNNPNISTSQMRRSPVLRQEIIMIEAPTPLDNRDTSASHRKIKKKNNSSPRNDDDFYTSPYDDFDEHGIPIKSDFIRDQVPVGSLFLEMLVVPTLILLPLGILRLTFDWPRYSLAVSQSQVMISAFREFERWSLFLGTSYFVYMACIIIFSLVPLILDNVYNLEDNAMPNSNDQTQCKDYEWTRAVVGATKVAMPYAIVSIGFLAVLAIATSLIFESGYSQSLRNTLSILNPTERGLFMSRRLGEWSESILSAAFFLFLFVTLQQYLFTAICHGYEAKSLQPRVKSIRDRLKALVSLYYATTGKKRQLPRADADNSMALIVNLDGNGLDITDNIQLSEEIFAAIKPSRGGEQSEGGFDGAEVGSVNGGNQVIGVEELRPFFAEGEHISTFKMIEGNGKDYISKSEFERMVEKLASDRTRVFKVLDSNESVLRKLDISMLIVFVSIGIFFGFIALGATDGISGSSVGRGLETTLGASAFILGLTFLLQPTISQLISVLTLVFADHPFDVCDRVSIMEHGPNNFIGNTTANAGGSEIENTQTPVFKPQNLVVEEINVLNSTLSNPTDGSLIYVPNVALMERTVCNRDRESNSLDCICFKISKKIPIASIVRFEELMKAKLALSEPEFTGNSPLIIECIDQSEASIRIDAEYRGINTAADSSNTGVMAAAYVTALNMRRARFMGIFADITGELGIDATITHADK